jgi:hypothetical protein
MNHLPECESKTLAEIYSDIDKPGFMSDVSWYEIQISDCALGCPIQKKAIERGRELAEKYGW